MKRKTQLRTSNIKFDEKTNWTTKHKQREGKPYFQIWVISPLAGKSQ